MLQKLNMSIPSSGINNNEIVALFTCDLCNLQPELIIAIFALYNALGLLYP